MRGCTVRGCGGESCIVDDCNPSPSAIDSGDIVWLSDFGDCAEITLSAPRRATCRACGTTVDEALLDAHWDVCGVPT